MRETEKEDILETIKKRRRNKLIMTFVIVFVIIIIFLVLGVLAYKYFQSPEYELELGADIEEFVLSESNSEGYVKLKAGSNDETKNITKVKFIFSDVNGNEYVYETEQGLGNISVPYKKGILDFFKGPEFKGGYDYNVSVDEVSGLESFENVKKVEVVFEYEKERGEIVQTPVLDTKKPTASVKRSGGSSGGGGGGGGGGSPGPAPCVPSKTCADYSGECRIGVYNGCENVLDCSDNCRNGEVCVNESCVEVVSCMNDSDCSYLSGVCGTGLCNLTTNSCDINYNISTTICRAGNNECDLDDYCNGVSVDCVDNKVIDGTDCLEGGCYSGVCVSNNDSFSFMFIGDDNIGQGGDAIEFAYINNPDLEIIFSIPDNGWRPREETHRRYVNQWSQNPNAEPGFTPLFMGLGNHDAEVIDSVNYTVEVLGPNLTNSLPGMRNFREGPYDIYPNGYEDRNTTYSFDYKNAHFIMWNGYLHDLLLDPPRNRFEGGYSPMSCVSEDLLNWLEEDLSNTNAIFKFMFYHEPAHGVPGGRHTGDSLDHGGCFNNSGGFMRDRFWSLLAKYNFTVNFVGHSHHSTVTWVNDLHENNGAFYEVEPGIPRRLAVVNIRGNEAVLNVFDSNFDKPFDSIIISKDNINHAPKIYQHQGGVETGYPLIDKKNLFFEVDQSFSTYGNLWFEAKDSDVEDEISFSFNNLPPFLAVNGPAIPYSYGRLDGTQWDEQYRRILMYTNTSNSNRLTESNIGDYSFDIIASDGIEQDVLNMNVSVVPANNPVILGASLPNNSVINFPMHRGQIYFVCEDKESGPVTLRYSGYHVLYNGERVGCCSYWHSYSGSTFTENLAASQFLFPDDYDNIKDVLPGRYDITAWCNDNAGHRSDNYTLTIFMSNGSDGVPESRVFGSWPANGANVNELDRISFWSTFTPTIDMIEVRKDGVIFNDYSLVTSSVNGSSVSWGTFALLFNNPAENGNYEFDIDGSIFTVRVDSGLGTQSIPKSSSVFSGIWNWIKGLHYLNKGILITKNALSIRDKYSAIPILLLLAVLQKT